MPTGGCFCAALRYEAAGVPFHATNCHCSICRRTTGAPFVTWFSIRRSDFRFTKGRPMEFHSSPKAVRTFCPKCGTQLTFAHRDYPDEIDVTTASLDDPNLVPPRDDTHISSRLDWIQPDGLPEYKEARSIKS